MLYSSQEEKALRQSRVQMQLAVRNERKKVIAALTINSQPLYTVDLFSGEKTHLPSLMDKRIAEIRDDFKIDRRLIKAGIVGQPHEWSEKVLRDLTLDVCEEIFEEWKDDMYALKTYQIKHHQLPDSDEFRQAFREEIAWMWGLEKRALSFDAVIRINGANPQVARNALLDNFREDVERALDELHVRVLH